MKSHNGHGDTWVLLKGKENTLDIVSYNQLMIRREGSKIKIGDEISWSGKSRLERGRGKVVAIGSKEQCESAKTVIEECNLNSICIAASDSSSVLDSQRSPPSLPKNQAAIVNPSSLTNNMTTTNPLNEIINERANSIATNRQTNLVMSNSSETNLAYQRSENRNSNEESESMDECSTLVIDEQVRSVTERSSELDEADNPATMQDIRSVIEENHSDEPVHKKARYQSSIPTKQSHVSVTAHAAVVQQNNKLLNQIEHFKMTWMPRPTDAKTIKFFVEVGKLLAGDTSDRCENDGQRKDERFAEFCDILEMDADELEECARAVCITKMCRSIVSKLIPKEERVGKTWRDIPSVKRSAILGVARMFHPSEHKTDGELIKACRNVFEVANSNRKRLEKYDS